MSSIHPVSTTDTSVAASGKKTTACAASSSFSSVLAQSALLAQATDALAGQPALEGAPGAPSDILIGLVTQDASGQGLESMAAEAAQQAISGGQTSDAMKALFMFCMMMQMGSGSASGSDSSGLMALMTAMLGQFSDNKETLYHSVMNPDYNADTLEAVEKIFSDAGYQPSVAVSGTDSATLPTQFWKPTTPAITNSADNRSPEHLRAVIDQFNVETAERYRPYRDGYTYCNIFVWDVTSALGAEIPHYVDSNTGELRTYPDTDATTALGATATERWLDSHGADYGWTEASPEQAQAFANAGKPAVTTAGSLGHVQVVCPSEDGGYDSVRGVTIAQAGSEVYNYTYISNIYGAATLNSRIRYWVHE
jgi:hypothetical protein